MEEFQDLNAYKAPSWGIEFEFDYIRKTGGGYVAIKNSMPECARRYYTKYHWRHQRDCTVGTELRSPVFTGIDQYLKEVKQEFERWIDANKGLNPYEDEYESFVPYLSGSGASDSIGAHTHIGIPNHDLTQHERVSIAAVTKWILPFLQLFNLNDFKDGYASSRMVMSDHCMKVQKNRPFGRGGYRDISANSNGTLEYRVFDAAPPQMLLTHSLLLREAARRALETGTEVLHNWSAYDLYRDEIANDNWDEVEIIKYLRRYLAISNPLFSNLPQSVKEILYMTLVEQLPPGLLLHVIEEMEGHATENIYDMYGALATTPSSFLSILIDHFPSDATVPKYFARDYLNKRFRGGAEALYNAMKEWKEEAAGIVSLSRIAKRYDIKKRPVTDDELMELAITSTTSKRDNIIEYCRTSTEFDSMRESFYGVYKDPSIDKIRRVTKNVSTQIGDTLWNVLFNRSPDVYQQRFNQDPSVVEEAIKHDRYEISRVHQHTSLDSDLIASMISDYTVQHALLKDYTVDDVRNCDERFYVLTVDNVLIGFGSATVFHGNLMTFYTRPQFRGMGVAKKVLARLLYVMTVMDDCPDTFRAVVLEENTAMKRVLATFMDEDASFPSDRYALYTVDKYSTSLPDKIRVTLPERYRR